jgi:cytoskeletal protein CcmA (bactofilin family)
MWNRDSAQEQLPPPASEPIAGASTPSALPAQERRVVAWIGKSILFRGDLISLEDKSIDGRVEGTIELRDHKLTVGPDARIQADIVAKTVIIHGAVAGTITASEAVHIAQTGLVEGDITSNRLAMAEGAVVKGRVNTGSNRGMTPTVSKPQAKVTG